MLLLWWLFRRIVAAKSAAIAIVIVAFDDSQSRLVKGGSRGLPLSKAILVVVFLPNIIVEGIPIVAGANGGHPFASSMRKN